MATKKKFSHRERYAVWRCGEYKCWICTEPLRLLETTVDHILPEKLLHDNEARVNTLRKYDLPEDFDINDYGNWAPAHARCNALKGDIIYNFVPAYKIKLDSQIKIMPWAKKIEEQLKKNITKDKILKAIFTGLENRHLSLIDVFDFLRLIAEQPVAHGLPDEALFLDDGYYTSKADIVHECLCRCERNQCVASSGKVYCYFTKDLSPWVISAGLFHKCYDEQIVCYRCNDTHARGHVGKNGICRNPYSDQENKSDNVI